MHDLLSEPQRWYLDNCDGDWEHTHGVSIDTLDNPGWAIAASDLRRDQVPELRAGVVLPSVVIWECPM